MTTRAIILGTIAALLLGLGTPYSDLVARGTWVGLTAFPISAFFVLVVLVALVNPVLRKLKRGLTKAELLVVFIMALVAAGIPSFGLTGLLIPYLAGPFYFATPENKYDELIQPYWPSWLHPRSAYAVEKLYEGLKEGQAVPWAEWLLPLGAASVLALGVYAVLFGLSGLLRKRWVDEEKLVFPLMELPTEMAQYQPSDAHPFGGFFRSRIMWAMCALPLLIHTLNGLHFHFPLIPAINVHHIRLDSHIAFRPWNAMSPLWLRVLFSIIALAYLLPQELSFSLWVFYFFFLAQQVVGAAFGLNMPNVQAYPVRQFVAHQMIGGIIVFGVMGLWGARAHLGAAARTIWAGASAEHDSSEPLPYATATVLAVAGWALIGVWGSFAGATLWATLLLFALFFLIHIVAVRLVCEGGMLYVQHPFRPLNLLLAAAGSRAFGPRPLAMLTLFDHLFMLDNRSPLMPEIMQGFKLADAGPLPRRPLTAAMAVSVVLAMLSSYWSYLGLMYRDGGATLNYWFTTYYTKNLYCTWTSHLIAAGESATPLAFLTMAVGGLSMWGLLTIHRSFLWWPLHPIGYLMGASWPMINYWFPIFLGWLVKTAVLWAGGPKVYRRLIPGFLGLIFGEFLSAGLWVLIDSLAGVRGHEIFSF